MASVRRTTTRAQYDVTSGNFAAVDAYEPGSVAKVITVAGALDAGAVTPDTGFNVPWRKQYYDDLLKDSHEHPDLWLTVSDILTQSSNIGTIMVQQALGTIRAPRLHDRLRARREDRTRLPRRVRRHLEGTSTNCGAQNA